MTTLDDYGEERGVVQEELTEAQINIIKATAPSRKNFAVRCMRRMFSEEDRRSANIGGQRGRPKLDPTGERLSRIYDYVMSCYEVPEEDRIPLWKECHLAMDVANRNFRNKEIRNQGKWRMTC